MFDNGDDDWKMIFREIGDAIGWIFGSMPMKRQVKCPDCHQLFVTSVPLRSEVACPHCDYHFILQ